MTLGPVLHSFGYGLDFLREQVADVASADMAAQPNGILNHPAWVIGHLAQVCQDVGGVIGVPPWLADGWAGRYGGGSAPVADVGAYAAKDDALAVLGDARSRITRAVGRLDESRLDEPFPDESLRDVFPSVRHFLTQVLVGHTAYHVGQVGAWRRAMRLPPVARGFE